jgi:biopolymer transport protein ExbD
MDGTAQATRGRRAESHVTPVIDALMVLSIVCMVVVATSWRATLVQSPAPQPNGEGAAIVLEIGPRGQLTLNEHPLELAQLGARLRAVYAGRPDKVIIIRGDGAARYQDVVTAIDVAREAGVRVVGLDPRQASDEYR